jgi:hypothetical protein
MKKPKNQKRMYFICNEMNGQRTGTYRRVYLWDNEIKFTCYGDKLHEGNFLYEKEIEVIIACQS